MSSGGPGLLMFCAVRRRPREPFADSSSEAGWCLDNGLGGKSCAASVAGLSARLMHPGGAV